MRPVLLVFALLAIGLATTVCGEAGPAPSPPAIAKADFVGSAKCIACHSEQAQRWQGSHHDLAMQPANATTVLGDFGDATFELHGVTTTFFRRGDEFLVRTDGPDGQLADFVVPYVFGVTPLQQYLVTLPGGRLQALDIAWDSRPAGDGGQRWFALHADERIDHRDPLHWTGPSLNWNHQCAECHSTNLQKGYDLAGDRYHTTWSEVDVACEACHGPGSAHVAWADEAPRDAATPAVRMPVQFGKPGTFVFDEGAVTARRVDGGTANEPEACGRCHSRRTPLTADYEHGRPLLDTHLVSLLDEDLYFVDGQIRDEVYVYGSFVQSRMHRAGVTCSDCHDAHSLQLRAQGNALCTRCHQASHFDRPEHHHHAAGSAGAACVECHMPERHYMVVDPRRDHSLRVPRPDLSVRFGTPNACTNCHGDRDARWAADAVKDWREAAGKQELPPHWTAALDAGRRGAPTAKRLLLDAAKNVDFPPIVRGTALSLLREQTTPDVIDALRQATAEPQPFVRLGATLAAGGLDAQVRADLLAPMLSDPVRAVRQAAGSALGDLVGLELPAALAASLPAAVQDYEQFCAANEDRDWAHVNLGILATRQRRPERAEAAYRQALRLAPGAVRAAVNLADLYRELGRDVEGEQVLRTASGHAYDQAPLQHALGLLLVRKGERQAGVELLAGAAALRPDDPRFAYTHGIALTSTGEIERGLAELQRAQVLHPYDVDLLLALTTLTRDHVGAAEAMTWARQLEALLPDSARIQELLRELQTVK